MDFAKEVKKIRRQFETKPINDQLTIKLETQLMQVYAQVLQSNGKEEVQINAKYRELTLLTHPDRRPRLAKSNPQLLEDLLWYENIVGKDSSFKLLTKTKERLFNPNPFSEQVGPQRSTGDILDELKRRSESSDTLFEKMFFESLHSVVYNRTKAHHIFNDEIGNTRLEEAHLVFSMLSSSVLAYLFSTEIALAYALGLGLNKAGSALMEGDNRALFYMGEKTKWLGDASLYTASSVLLQVFNLNNLAITYPYYGYSRTKALCSSLFAPAQESATITFDDPCLNDVASSLKQYTIDTKQQWMVGLRKGGHKITRFEQAIEDLKQYDSPAVSKKDKVSHAQSVIRELLDDESVCGDEGHAKAVLLKLKYKLQKAPTEEEKHARFKFSLNH